LVLFAAALLALYHELRHYRPQEIRVALEGIPVGRLLLALLFTVLSYALLTLYDWMGLRYAGAKLGYGRVAFASFSAYVFSYNIGFSVLGGAAVRYRLYSGWGFSGLEVARVIVFVAATFWLGLATVLGSLFLTGTGAEQLGLPVWAERGLGAGMVAAVAAYLASSIWVDRPFRLRQIEWAFPPPPWRWLRWWLRQQNS